MKQKRSPDRSTSWQAVHGWYDELVGQKGHYYHEHVIIPKLLDLLQLEKGHSVLDLASGQGILARALPKGVSYIGIDASKDLIQAAKRYSSHTFLVGDVTKPLQVLKPCTHATCILAIQNIERPDLVFQNLAPHLVQDGRFVCVMNHPCFRIPRQSGWGFDEATKIQYRKMNGYMTPQKIPIEMHPGAKKSTTTWSFHRPLSDYSRWLFQAGFQIERIEEWCSDKESTGARAAAENRARKEFPLFLALVARKT